MSQPIFPKGTKVVKGKVVQRKLPTSRMDEFKQKQQDNIRRSVPIPETSEGLINNKKLMKDIALALQKGRTGPRLAPGQQSKARKNKVNYSLGDPRLERELPKIKPGTLEKDVGTRQIEGYDIEGEPLRNMDMEMRSLNPAMEGRGPSPLSKIIEALEGQKMPPSLLQELKGLDPVKLEKILALIKKSKVGKERQQLNAETKRYNAAQRRWAEEDTGPEGFESYTDADGSYYNERSQSGM